MLSDTNADFVVIGLCSAEGSSSGDSSVTEALAALLSGQPQQAAPPSAAPQLQGLRMHVSALPVHSMDHKAAADDVQHLVHCAA